MYELRERDAFWGCTFFRPSPLRGNKTPAASPPRLWKIPISVRLFCRSRQSKPLSLLPKCLIFLRIDSLTIRLAISVVLFQGSSYVNSCNTQVCRDNKFMAIQSLAKSLSFPFWSLIWPIEVIYPVNWWDFHRQCFGYHMRSAFESDFWRYSTLELLCKHCQRR